MSRRSFAALAASLALLQAPALATAASPAPKGAASKDVCAAMQSHMTAKGGAPAAGATRPLSAESKQMLGQLTAMGGRNGSAAPNPQAQAMLNMMASAFASRSDAESQAAAAYMRQMGAKPGTNTAADMKALGC